MAGSSNSLLAYAHRVDRLDPNDSTFSLLSRRGSGGSRYFQVEDSGVYLTSVAVTVLVSSVAILGILLISLAGALWMMLESCQSHDFSFLAITGKDTRNYCHAFVSNAEVNNVQHWSLPGKCEQFVAAYMTGGQYLSDVAGATQAAKSYLESFAIQPDGFDIVVLDIDETALSNLPHYEEHHYGAEPYDEDVWNDWVDEARAVPLLSTLQLYNELLAANWGIVFITGRTEDQRNATTENLIAAGYHGWTALILRSESEHGLSALEYKSQHRVLLESSGFRIRSGLGDQWTDITGPAAGNRTFKLPNPMYYVA